MAALPTGTKVFHTVVGNMQLGCYSFAANASGTTFSAPVAVVKAAWLTFDDTAPATSKAPYLITLSGNTVTVTDVAGAAAASGVDFDIFYIGY